MQLYVHECTQSQAGRLLASTQQDGGTLDKINVHKAEQRVEKLIPKQIFYYNFSDTYRIRISDF